MTLQITVQDEKRVSSKLAINPVLKLEGFHIGLPSFHSGLLYIQIITVKS